MQIDITGHHVEITDSMRQYVEDKMQKLERHFDKVSNMHVILSVENVRQKAEATLHLSGQDIFAEDTQDNMYAAIDSLLDKLDRQVVKYKEKIKNHHHKQPEV